MSTGLLDGAWTRRAGQDRPRLWFGTEPGELFPPQVAAQLAADFPTEGYTRIDASGRTEGKSYRNYSRPLSGPGDPADKDLSPLWAQLIDEVHSEEYRRGVARTLGRPVAAAVEARLVRHVGGDWLGPHTDRPDKAFSHIVYFNPGWRAQWGGCLQILGSQDPGDVVAEVVPRLGASALLVPSADSWHQVGAVSAASASERRSLLIHGLL